MDLASAPLLISNPLWWISTKFTNLPAPVQGGIVSALISTTIAFVIFLLGYIYSSRPILVFSRRPDWFWRIQNLGRGGAFDIRLEDKGPNGAANHFRIYPIAEKERIELGELTYGDELRVYYSTRSGKRKYCTRCKGWIQTFDKPGVRAFPDWNDMVDEARLKRVTKTSEQALADAISKALKAGQQSL
jgi:hypothetical protein